MKNALIISYTFPPEPGIGGRRWAKFSKYLSRTGVNISVLAADSSPDLKSFWDEDIEGLDVTRLPDSYPGVLKTLPLSIYQRFSYALWVRILRLVSNGSIYDKAIFWKRDMLKAAGGLIAKNGFKNIIVTGAPFRVLYYGALLKKKNPSLNLIADFRDPWVWGELYGFSAMSKKRKDQERKMQDFVMTTADHITAPSVSMIEHLKEAYPQFSHKLFLLEHGFDEEDFLQDTPATTDDTRIKILLGGTFYTGIEDQVREVIRVADPNSTRLIFILPNEYGLQAMKKINPGNKAEVKAGLDPRHYFTSLKSADFFLVIFPPRYKDFISTKFYEYIYAGKPILYIGDEGRVSEFIKEYRLGTHILPGNISSEFLNAIGGGREIKSSFPIKNYSFRTLSKKIADHLLR